jgi:N-acetylmuramoyl-L-alanine amidase
VAVVSLCCALLPIPAALAAAAGRPPAKVKRTAARSSRPDAALYQEATRAEKRLFDSRTLQAKRAEWDKVLARYRKLVARYPKSGYADNALLGIGDLSRTMARRFRSPRLLDDAVHAYRMLVAEYPSSSLGERALYAAFEIALNASDRSRIAEAGRAYLDAFPDAARARTVKSLLRRKVPERALPSPPPPGLARLFDLRFWSGDESTRVVLDLERKVKFTYDRLTGPDRLFVDLQRTRLHPNLTSRTFPVGDGLLAQVRIGQNKDDVVRVVLDFKEVYEHGVFYLEEDNRPRLVIDIRGTSAASRAGKKVADAPQPTGAAAVPADAAAPAPAAVTAPAVPEDELPPPTVAADGAGTSTAPPTPAPEVATLPTRPLPGMLPPASPAPAGSARRAVNVVIEGTRPASPAPTAAALPPPPAPPAVNRDGSYSLARQLGLGARRIVIDPGHGGHDPGTIGRGGLMEKDLVLDVALRLERLVRQELGADVVMTRSRDVFIPLEERTAIANQRAADLFLSIHANASRSASARGIETYFLNFAKNPHAEAVAARENAISSATLKDLQGLVKAITLNTKIDESRDFATSVQEAMVKHLRDHGPAPDRGVHTAPFYVLIGANMPSVLAEIAFVSHPEDERRLKKPAFREEIARSLFKGVRGYLEALSRTQTRRLTSATPGTTVPMRREARGR